MENTKAPKIKLFYLRNESGHPVACVASTLTHNEASDPKDHIRYAVSTHNPLDIFSKERGRTIALGRLTVGSVYSSSVDVGKGAKERILMDLCNDEIFPQRARIAAANWLAARGAFQSDTIPETNEEVVQNTPPRTVTNITNVGTIQTHSYTGSDRAQQ